jgi:ATP/maltotriose-dependent transcriptional regulator MalT
LTVAAALVEEVQAATEATGSDIAPYGALGLRALQGREAGAAAMIDGTRKKMVPRGEGIGITVAEWAGAMLHNGLGNYRLSVAAASRATEDPHDLGAAHWALVELIEAAARSGMAQKAADAYTRLRGLTEVSGTDWALGVQARSRALLSDGAAAERLYREAIARLGRTRVRVDLARAHLLYGEWLRGQRRRADAREQLRTAHELLATIGAEAFAERARDELLAAGEKVRTARVETRGPLTAQETRIARLARDGLSNPEIGTRLFISPRTVKYHLRKVFIKLDISSRNELDRVLPTDPATTPPVPR